MSLKVPEGRVRLLYLSKWDFLLGEKKKIIGAQWIKEYWLLKIYRLCLCAHLIKGRVHFFTSLDVTPKSRTGLVSWLIHIRFTLQHIFISCPGRSKCTFNRDTLCLPTSVTCPASYRYNRASLLSCPLHPTCKVVNKNFWVIMHELTMVQQPH